MSNHYIFSQKVGVIQDILNLGGTIHNLDDPKSIEFLEDIYSQKSCDYELEKNKQIVTDRFSLESIHHIRIRLGNQSKNFYCFAKYIDGGL